ncbi:MAG: penicillin-binding protein 2 MrdA [Oceanicaulis sp. HLUCCA04]|nr:MAG: penicillin-binding protein 2 MrdA [Oceanicaulis sp. HLUCCA04]
MRRDKQEAQAQFNRRTVMTGAVGVGVFAGIGAQLYNLQILREDEYQVLSDNNQFSFRIQLPTRGRILDRFGETVAENRDSYRIYLVREQAGDPALTLDRLSQFMEISDARRERILRDLARTPRFQPVTVAEGVDWETFSRVNLHLPELPGVMPDVGEVRTYPMPAAFAHIAGYVQSAPPEIAGDDPLLRHPAFRVGRSGVEIARDSELRGSAGSLKVEVNAFGRVIRELPEQSRPAEPGQDIALTLDSEVQRFATERLGTESASAVGIDVHTGEIVTMASTPSFDPNLFVLGIPTREFSGLNENPLRPLFNKATNGLYAPASTVKGIMSLAALRHGIIRPNERVTCRGSVQLGNRRFHCWRREGHGPVNMHDAIKVSCDIFFYEIASRLGIERIRETALEMGLGQLFDIGIPMLSQAGGLFPSPQWKRARTGEGWSMGDTYNVGIGQGAVLASPLQLAVMTARMATGRVVEPTLYPRSTPHEFPRMDFDEAHIQAVHNAHVGVVHEPGGTSYWSLGGLGIEGVRMAGKTGTSQVYSISAEERASGVRDQDDLPWRLRNHGLFICYAPAEAPRYAVAVVVEHGGGGARSAAQPGRDILRELVLRDPAGRSGIVAARHAPINLAQGG